MIDWIKNRFAEFNYSFNDSHSAFYMNIFAVRSNQKIAGFFDDTIYLVYRDQFLKWRIEQFDCTTDPGIYWLKRPLNVDGTAVLLPGQYVDTYKVDMHNGKQQALCQRLGDVEVFRDNNRDGVIDVKTIQKGKFGINIHGTYHDDILTEIEKIGKWSAGCTVLGNKFDFVKFMKLCRTHAGMYGNVFTYTLFTEDQFNLDLSYNNVGQFNPLLDSDLNIQIDNTRVEAIKAYQKENPVKKD